MDLPASKSEGFRESEPWKAAQLAASEKDWALARRSLETLRKSDGLSEADRAFLDGQVATLKAKESGQTETLPLSGPSPSPKRADCGPRALSLAAKALGVQADAAKIAPLARTDPKTGTSLEGLERAAKALGLAAVATQRDRDSLSRLSTPAVA